MNDGNLNRTHYRHRLLQIIYGLVLSFGISVSSSAMPTVVIDKPVYDPIPLRDLLEYYVPGMTTPDSNDVLAVSEYQWKPIQSLPASTAFAPRQTLWYRVQLINAQNSAQNLIFRNTNPATDTTTCYLVSDKLTIDTPLTSLDHHYSNQQTARITLPAHSTRFLYIAVKGFHGGQAPFTLHGQSSYENLHQHQQWMNGLINGAILGLMIYNLFLWQKTRQKMYFAYFLLGTFNVLTIITHRAILTHSGFGISEELNTTLSLTLPLIISQCLVFFFQQFMETKKNHSRLHLFLNAYMASTLLIIAAWLLGAPMILTTPIFFGSSLAATVLMLRTAVISQHINTLMRYLVIGGLTMPILSALITALASAGIPLIERDYMTLMQSTDVMEMLLFSFAMAYKIHQLQVDHKLQIDKSNEETITNAAQDRVIAHINHEFRTPLNGILGAAELLISKSESNNADMVNMIYQTALPLKVLIDDLVNIDAVSQNNDPSLDQRFDLEQLLQECTDVFLAPAKKQQVRLYFAIDPSVTQHVNGNPYKLRQILLNLLGNAFKFTRHGVIGVFVTRELQTDATKLLYRFEIYDSGHTISPAMQEKLFQQFEKGTAQTALPSAGLGLSIVKDISQSMGGDCGYTALADSPSGYGNLFWFCVELKQHLPIKRAIPATFEYRRILIADSSSMLAKTLSTLIGKKQAQIEIVNTAEALHQLAISKHFDIALIQHSLLTDTFDLTALEDIADICTYADSHEDLNLTTELKLAVIRPNSMRKFVFKISEQITTTNTIHPAHTHAIAKTSTTRVLVAEDNPTSQIIISEILKRFPLLVDTCNNGLEAERAFQAMISAGTPYKAIFMDCEMPHQDGFTTTRNIRQYEAQHQLPRTIITALTAHTESNYKANSRSAGMDDFLSKPITIESVSLCLQKAGLIA